MIKNKSYILKMFHWFKKLKKLNMIIRDFPDFIHQLLSFVCFVLFAISILHSRESELYRYTFGREVRTRLGVAFFEVYGPPVFHIKAGPSR